MRKYLVGAIFGMLLMLSVTAFADSSLMKISTYLNPIHIQMNHSGKITSEDIDTILYKDKTYVPLSYIAQRLDSTVSYFPNGNLSVFPPTYRTITIDSVDIHDNEIKDTSEIVGLNNIKFEHGKNESVTFQIKQYKDLPIAAPYLVLSFYDDKNKLLYTQGLTTRLYSLIKGGYQTWYVLLDTDLSTLNSSQLKVSFAETAPVTYHKGELAPLPAEPTYVMNLKMFDNQMGWAEGYELLRTNDNGHSWLKSVPKELHLLKPDSGIKLQDYFVDQQNAWISKPPFILAREQETTVWHTNNGGQVWSRSTLPIIEKWEQHSTSYIYFCNDKQGYILLRSFDENKLSLFSSADGGVVWKREGEVKGLSERYPINFMMLTDLQGWLSDGDHLYQTMDGGLTWKTVSILIPSSYKASGFYSVSTPVFYGPDQNNGVIVLQLSTTEHQQLIFHTNNRGGNWTFTGEAPNTEPISFIPNKRGGILGTAMMPTKQLYFSRDGGKTWIEQVRLPENLRSNELLFSNDKEGWITDGYPGNVYFTGDGGLSWSPLRSVKEPTS
ncbi:hypothetical protein BVG16_27890 [Paenibacillus selenitireducens]|uniref:Copper amine oxidase-like N-terminal domain-containing protein n=2 Tax=Paenibacillus selenitireducens TaxID=1324314 RepID=A0A1T2X149_9BACL|nr:hypothetical protein BVG16_27890 [Paenibacillus selenitireducens]